MPNCGNLEMNLLYFVAKARFTEQKLKLSILQVREQLLNLLNQASMKKRPYATPARSKRGTGGGRTYKQTLEFCRGGEGPISGSTQPTWQFHQPPRAWN